MRAVIFTSLIPVATRLLTHTPYTDDRGFLQRLLIPCHVAILDEALTSGGIEDSLYVGRASGASTIAAPVRTLQRGPSWSRYPIIRFDLATWRARSPTSSPW